MPDFKTRAIVELARYASKLLTEGQPTQAILIATVSAEGGYSIVSLDDDPNHPGSRARLHRLVHDMCRPADEEDAGHDHD